MDAEIKKKTNNLLRKRYVDTSVLTLEFFNNFWKFYINVKNIQMNLT